MDWIPAVKSQLETMGHSVITPTLPTGLLASYTLWKSAVSGILQSIPREAILVGHGIGGNILLSLLSETVYDPTMLILVNTPCRIPDHAGYRKLSNTFFTEPYIWEHITGQVKEIHVLVSDNDPFVAPTSSHILTTVCPTWMSHCMS